MVIMVNFNTHIKFVNNFKEFNLDLKYLESGAIFPDIGQYVKLSNHEDITELLHFPEPDSKDGLTFSESLIKSAKTKEEFSFAIGMYSHFFLDNKIHIYFDELKLSLADHIVLEYYLAYEDVKFKVNKLYFPKEFFVSIFRKQFSKNKLFSEYLKQINNITNYTLFKYKFVTNAILNYLIKNNYGDKQKKLYLLRMVFGFFRKSYLSKYNLDVYELLYPNLNIKNKYMPKVNKIVSDAESEFKSKLNGFCKNKEFL